MNLINSAYHIKSDILSVEGGEYLKVTDGYYANIVGGKIDDYIKNKFTEKYGHMLADRLHRYTRDCDLTFIGESEAELINNMKEHFIKFKTDTLGQFGYYVGTAYWFDTAIKEVIIRKIKYIQLKSYSNHINGDDWTMCVHDCDEANKENEHSNTMMSERILQFVEKERNKYKKINLAAIVKKQDIRDAETKKREDEEDLEKYNKLRAKFEKTA